MQMIIAVELRQIYGCIIGYLIHDLSLGIQRTFFYIMYIKPRYSFALFSLTSLASRSREKENHFKSQESKAGVEIMLRKKCMPGRKDHPSIFRG